MEKKSIAATSVTISGVLFSAEKDKPVQIIRHSGSDEHVIAKIPSLAEYFFALVNLGMNVDRTNDGYLSAVLHYSAISQVRF